MNQYGVLNNTHFVGDSPPSTPIEGDTWYNRSTDELRSFTANGRWVRIGMYGSGGVKKAPLASPIFTGGAGFEPLAKLTAERVKPNDGPHHCERTRYAIEKFLKEKIKTKITNYLPTEELAKRIADNIIIAGGAISSLLEGTEPNDYDVYLRNSESLKTLVDYFHDHWVNKKQPYIVTEKPNSISYQAQFQMFDCYFDIKETELCQFMEMDECSVVEYVSTNAISLSNKTQIITRVCGDPEYVVGTFDFVHCTNYYTEKTGLVLNADALESLITRQLKYNNSCLEPTLTIERIAKFAKRGWDIKRGEINRILQGIKSDNS